MSFEAILSAGLAASVSLNLALLIRGYQLTRLDGKIDKKFAELAKHLADERVEDRHQTRTWVAAIAMQIGEVRMVLNEVMVRFHPGESRRLHIPEPPPFDSTKR